jgi:lysozyme
MRVDFHRMKQEGIAGVIHEVTYPRYNRDDKYSYRQSSATRAGLLWGAYHFADATDPVRQADHMLRVVSTAWLASDPQARPKEVLLVLDFEKNGHYPGGTMRVHQAVTFINRIRERTGKYPLVYSNEYRVRDVLNGRAVTSAQRQVLSNCSLWIANYHYQPRSTSPWGHWSLWQYTGDGICDVRPRAAFPKHIANVRNAERNMFRGSRDSLPAFWQRHSWTPGQ